jgi:mannose-6-phosphate isomerase-like protein (cupin superfamily)
MSDKPLVHADLIGLIDENGTGPLWSTESEDLDSTFVRWEGGYRVLSHVNAEVDVLMVVVSGAGSLVVDDECIDLSQGKVVMVPKGSSRSIEAGVEGLAYVNVHKRRKRLGLGDSRDRLRGQASLKGT